MHSCSLTCRILVSCAHIVEDGAQFKCYAHVTRSGQVAVMAVCDCSYPQRAATAVLTRLVKEDRLVQDAQALVTSYIGRFQDPAEADQLVRIHQDLDTTKLLMHKTLDGMLRRGEKLDDMVKTSTQLSTTSKQFYTTSKKMNSCCTVF